MTPAEIEDRLHEGMTRRAPGNDDVTRRMARTLRLTEGSRVLDLAAGTSLVAPLLAFEFGASVLAVDRDVAALDRVDFAARKAGVEENVNLLHGDETTVELPALPFDAVICEGAVPRLGGPAALLARIQDRVRPGGGVALTLLVRDRGPVPPETVSMFGPLLRLSEVLALLAAAAFEPLAAELMPRGALLEWATATRVNAEEALALAAPPELADGARKKKQELDAVHAAGSSIAFAMVLGRKLDESGLPVTFGQARRA